VSETAKVLKKVYAGSNEIFDGLYDLYLDRRVKAHGYSRPTRILRVGTIQGKVFDTKDPRIDGKEIDEIEEIPVDL